MSHPELEIHKTASLLANSSLREEVVDAGRGRGPVARAQKVCWAETGSGRSLAKPSPLGGVRWLLEKISLSLFCLSCASL